MTRRARLIASSTSTTPTAVESAGGSGGDHVVAWRVMKAGVEHEVRDGLRFLRAQVRGSSAEADDRRSDS